MGVFKKYAFAKRRAYKQNTFIGGVAATINTPALLASRIQIVGWTAFNPNNIKNFEVRGNDIRCSIIEDFILTQDSFGYNSGCTYFVDKGNRAKVTGIHPWRNGATVQAQALIKKAELNGVTSIDRDFTNSTTNNLRSIRLKSLTSINPTRTFTAMSNCKLYIPSLQTIGLPGVNNEVFAGSTNSTIYVHPFLATCNGGNPDADLVAAIAAGNTVVYVLNQTPPAKITTLSIGTKTATTLQLNFTAPTSLNTIANYEVFIDEIPHQIISGSGQYITGLTTATLYKRIEVRAIDIYYNRAEQMDEANMVEATTL